MSPLRIVPATLLSLFLVAACGEEVPVGEPCDNVGETDECVDGAICTNESSSSGNRCRVICTTKTDCGAEEECSGISGTNVKSCKPDDNSSGT